MISTVRPLLREPAQNLTDHPTAEAIEGEEVAEAEQVEKQSTEEKADKSGRKRTYPAKSNPYGLCTPHRPGMENWGENHLHLE